MPINTKFKEINSKYLNNNLIETNEKNMVFFINKIFSLVSNGQLTINYNFNSLKDNLISTNDNWIYCLQDNLLNKKNNFEYNAYSKYKISTGNYFAYNNLYDLIDENLLHIYNFYKYMQYYDFSEIYNYYLYVGLLSNYDFKKYINTNNNYILNFNNNFIYDYNELQQINNIFEAPFFVSEFSWKYISKSLKKNSFKIKNKINYKFNIDILDIKKDFNNFLKIIDYNVLSKYIIKTILKTPINNEENEFIHVLGEQLSKLIDPVYQDYKYENSLEYYFNDYIDNNSNAIRINNLFMNNLIGNSFDNYMLKEFDLNNIFDNFEFLKTEFDYIEDLVFDTVKTNVKKHKNLELRSIEYINNIYKSEYVNFINSYFSSYMLYYTYLIDTEFYDNIGLNSFIDSENINQDSDLVIEEYINKYISHLKRTNQKININLKDECINSFNYAFFVTMINITDKFVESKQFEYWIYNNLIVNIKDILSKYRPNFYQNINYNIYNIKLFFKIYFIKTILNNSSKEIEKLFNQSYNKLKGILRNEDSDNFNFTINTIDLLNKINYDFNGTSKRTKENVINNSLEFKQKYLALFISILTDENLSEFKL